MNIAFLFAALNYLDTMACDIGNSYLNVEFREKIWFVSGPECCDNAVKVCKLVRALYVLKFSVEACRALFSNFIQEDLKFKPTRIDPDVYIINNYKSGNKPYWGYLLFYVNYVLFIQSCTIPSDETNQLAL